MLILYYRQVHPWTLTRTYIAQAEQEEQAERVRFYSFFSVLCIAICLLSFLVVLCVLKYLYIIPNTSGASVMLFSPQDERKLIMLENSLNFKFKRIGTPGAKEIAEASAVVAAKR
jgi:hypothetical protein